jgi:hypothetical protein
MFPGHKNFLPEAFKLARKSDPYAYLLISTLPQVPQQLRVRSHIMPDETNYVYLPSDGF